MLALELGSADQEQFLRRRAVNCLSINALLSRCILYDFESSPVFLLGVNNSLAPITIPLPKTLEETF